MSDEKQPERVPRMGTLPSIVEHIRRPGSTRFDEALVTFLNGIAMLHSETVGDCSAGHQYSEEYEICAEHHDAHELAAAWMQSKLEGGS